MNRKAAIKFLPIVLVMVISLFVSTVGAGIVQEEFIVEDTSEPSKEIIDVVKEGLTKNVLTDSEVDIINRDVVLNLKVEDSKKNEISYLAEISNDEDVIVMVDSDFESEQSVKEGDYQVTVHFEGSPIESISFNDLKIANEEILLGVDYVDESKITSHDFVKVYAIDPERVPFTKGKVSVEAKGNALYKCKDWDFSGQSCYGSWNFLQSITPGEVYSFELTPDDPGFGEINITDALHLDENYVLVKNIYEEVKAVDDVWSESIYASEYVRVTFAENLTNGRMIDILARSNGTLTYFEIYEEGTTNLVGQSGVIDYPEVQFISVDGLTEPMDVFDFKILRVNSDINEYTQCVYDGYLECDEDPYEGCYEEVELSCDSPIYHHDRTAFLEFDFIHDDVINSTQADGLIGYEEANVATPRYRKWNNTNDFEIESSAQATGTNTVEDITWNVVKGNHERNEIIMGTYDKGNDINVQIFDSSSWNNLTEVTANAENSAYRGFDIAYEDLSGDALIVYENNNVADSIVGYRIWNGTAYTAEANLTTGLASGEVLWVSLIENIGSDSIMLLIHNDLNDLYAIPWNGTDFLSSLELVLSTGTTSNTEEHFAFAWEESSGQGLVTYGEGNNLVYRTYDPVGGFGVTESTIALGNGLDSVRMCSEPTSDYIGIIMQDAGRDVNVRMWDGSTILTGSPSQDAATEGNGANNGNADCAWVNSTNALFGFVDNNALAMDWFEFSKTNTWSTADLTSTSTTSLFAADDIKSLRFTEHPTTQEVMVVSMDILEDVRTIYWNGTEIIVPSISTVEALTEVTNGAQESAMFDWFRYDSVPNVTSLNPTGESFTASSAISINASIADNLVIGAVLANVTHPNGTVERVILADGDGDNVYNLSFTETSNQGTYTIRIIANDTSVHKNINSSMTTTFVIADAANPAVTNLLPTANSVYNISNSFEISANVTDSSALSVVIANLSYPNGTIDQQQLSTLGGAKYNVSFIVPQLTGVYNITFFANDTGNNINNSETTNFTVNDVVNPTVTNAVPVIDTSFNVSNTIEIAVNVSDDVAVSVVLVNVTYPNGSVGVFQMGFTSDSKYNISFVAPAVTGRYNTTFIANDTFGNINNTGTTNFTINDVTALSITGKVCKPSAANLTQSVECNATVTDDSGIHTVLANVTTANGTVYVQTITNASAEYTFTFLDTNKSTGIYNITWWANDTSDNSGNSTHNFTVSDVGVPTITLNAPIAGYNISTTTVNFNFTAIDNFDTSMNCSLRIDDSVDQSDSAVVNGTQTVLSKSSISEGAYNWSVKCSDDAPNTGTSLTREFIIDRTNVSFVTLDFNPKTENTLDPNVIVNITANVTDSLSGVHTVILQYKNVTATSFTNLTMVINGSNIYNTSFTTSSGATNYTFRVWANDTAGNADFSINKTVNVSLDRTWSRSPSSISPVIASLNTNVSLGNVTIENNGDYALNFTITSTLNTTYFNNATSNVQVLSGENYTLGVNATSANTGSTNFNITYNTTTNAIPTQLNTTATVVVASGQPVLVMTWNTFPSSVTQGDTSVDLVAQVENIGEGDASNVSMFYTLPSEWTTTFGSLVVNFTEILSGEIEENTIQVTVESSATAGIQNIIANSTAVNATGIDLHSIDLIFEDTEPVTVNEPPPDVGSGSGGGSGGGSSGSSSGGGAGSGGGTVDRAGTGETIRTTEVYTVVRGSDAEIPVVVSNFYEHSYFTDVELEVQGFMSQYVTVEEVKDYQNKVYVGSVNLKKGPTDGQTTLALKDLGVHTVEVMDVNLKQAVFTFYSEPVMVTVGIGETQEVDLDGDGRNDVAVEFKDVINAEADFNVYKLGNPSPDKVQYKEERKYVLNIFAPSYVNEEDYNLTVAIKAKIIPFNTRLAGFNYKPLVEFRTLLFKVIKISPENAQKKINNALDAIKEMKIKEFPTIKVEAWVREAEAAFEKEDYGVAAALAEQVLEESDLAFKANDLIVETEEWVVSAKDKWLIVDETEKAVVLAIKAFEREDFSAAFERAKEAQLVYIIETKGRINIVWFVGKYWWAIILGLIGVSLLAFFSYKKFVVAIINQRLKNLAKEEVSLNSLIKEAQHRHLEEGTMSSTEYHRAMAQYEGRLSKIQRIRSKLRNKKIGFMRTEQEIRNLKKEEADLMSMMKELQIEYLQKGVITKKQFAEKYTHDKEDLADVEEEIELLTEKLELEKVGKKYKFLSGVNRASVSGGALFRTVLERLKSKEKVSEDEKPVEEKSKETKKKKGNKRKYLKKDPISKKNRKDVYDMLKKEHGIDVEDEDE
jgi:uncharacterized membrane protein YgcG